MTGRKEHGKKIEENCRNVLKRLPSYVSDWYYVVLKDLQETTRYNYLKKVDGFISSIGAVEPEDITREKVRDYLISFENSEVEYSGDHKSNIWSALKSFLCYLQDERLINNVVNIGSDGKIKLAGFRKPKLTNPEEIKERRKVLTKDDFQKILDVIDDEEDYVVYARNKAIMLLLMTTGMRRSALLDINVEDYNPESAILNYVDKREKYYSRKLPEKTNDAIIEWLSVRKRYAMRSKEETSAMFLSRRGNRLEKTSLEHLVKKYSKNAIGYELSPHKFRAGLASILYEETNDIEFVRSSLRHSSSETTQRYIKTVDDAGSKAGEMMANLLD